MYNYRIYLYGSKGYEYIDTIKDEKLIDNYKDTEGYTKILVIRHNIPLNMDEPYYQEDFKVYRKEKENANKNNRFIK